MSPNYEMTTTSPVTSPTVETEPTADQGAHSRASYELAVTLPANLHARPAGKLAQAAARFSSAIRLDYAGKSVNPTGVLAVMGLGAAAGTTVTLRAEGDDAEQAVRALGEILANAE
jgi:phosphotransferase system HPr (HPr) family protein